MKYVDILFPLPVDSPYTYQVPVEMEQELCIGQIVRAKIRTNIMSGVITGIKNQQQVDPSINYLPLLDIIGKESFIPENLLAISKWVAEYYLSTWGEVLSVVSPPGLLQKNTLRVKLRSNSPEKPHQISDTQMEIVRFLENKLYISLSTIRKKLKITNIQYHVRKLIDLNILESKTVSSVKMPTRIYEYYYCLKSEMTSELWDMIRPNAVLQKLVLENLTKSWPDPLSHSYLTSILNINSTLLNRLKEMGLIEIEKKEISRSVQWKLKEDLVNLDLNKDQQEIVSYIQAKIPGRKFHSSLIWGVTGSGKTQIYIELAKNILNQGKSVLILAPEISLTPQLINRFRFFLQTKVGTYHSKLSIGERFDTWRQVLNGDIKVIVGARSAVFLPFPDLGMIVVDEEHEYSYKQSEKPPRYNARDVAMYIAQKSGSIYICGSATPSMESLYLCQNNKMKLHRLNDRVKNIPLPRIHVVDLNHSVVQQNDGTQISESLLQEIQARMLTKEQVLLFKNLRGYAPYIQCSDCHYIFKCPTCDVTLTFHKKSQALHCHYCGYTSEISPFCPQCKSYNLQLRGSGTEKIEERLQYLFKESTIIRLDLDSVRGKDAYIDKIDDFYSGRANILIGTKMVTKGLDFPNLSLVGVLNGDMEFSFPDFRSQERGFQTMLQVSGRSGRSEVQGTAIIQTYMPENDIFVWLKKHDYESFAKSEMEQRKALNYPPFARLLLIRLITACEETGMKFGQSLKTKLDNLKNKNFEVLGPVFSAIKKIRGVFRVHIIIKIPRENNKELINLKNFIKYYIIPAFKADNKIKLEIDVDPVEIV